MQPQAAGCHSDFPMASRCCCCHLGPTFCGHWCLFGLLTLSSVLTLSDQAPASFTAIYSSTVHSQWATVPQEQWELVLEGQRKKSWDITIVYGPSKLNSTQKIKLVLLQFQGRPEYGVGESRKLPKGTIMRGKVYNIIKQAHSCLSAFALLGPLVWSVLFSALPKTHSSLSSEIKYYLLK